MGRHKKYLTVEDRRIARNKKQKKYRSSTEYVTGNYSRIALIILQGSAQAQR